jgi:hypothetical protein
MQKTDVQIVASERARENMVDGKFPGLPNMVFDHHASVWLGGKNAELYYFGRAHTNGDVVVLFLPIACSHPVTSVTNRAEMAKFRTSTLTLRNRVNDMVAQKKSRDDVAAMLKKEFRFAQLHLDRSLDGLMAEMR